MALLLPLVWMAWMTAGDHSTSDDGMPTARTIEGVPPYALDQFTRSGNMVAKELLTMVPELQHELRGAGVPRFRQHRVVGDLLFLAEGSAVRRRTIWHTGEKLRQPYRMLQSVPLFGPALPQFLGLLASKSDVITSIRRKYILRQTGQAT